MARLFRAAKFWVIVFASPCLTLAQESGRPATEMVLLAADAPALDAWLDQTRGTGMRPRSVQAHETADGLAYTAIAALDPGGPEWSVRKDHGAQAFLEGFRDLSARNFRLASITVAEGMDGELEYVTVWLKALGLIWTCYIDQDREALRGRVDTLAEGGQVLQAVSCYRREGAAVFAALWAGVRESPRKVETGIPFRALEATVRRARDEGSRPMSVSCTSLRGGRDRAFAIVLGRDTPERRWEFRSGMTAESFRAEQDRRSGAGEALDVLTAYPAEGGEVRYLAVWLAPGGTKLPATGEAVAGLEPLEAALRRFLEEHGVPAATLAVARDGWLVLERGYGRLDPEGTRPVPPDTPMRLASLSKPITAAAVRKLAAKGKLDLGAKVVDSLDVRPQEGAEMDARWRNITVAHLLDHRGGWDRDQAGDPMFRAIEIARGLEIPPPAGAGDVLRHMAGQPLQFAPGERYCYSNFGYSVLGRIVEKASGQTYEAYVREHLLAPLGITSMAIGRSLPGERDPREPSYEDGARGPSVFDPGTRVPLADGGFHLEAMDSHGGWIGSAADYARFLAAYHMNGEPCAGKVRGYDETFFGSLPGTFAVAFRTPDGTVVVALMNQRHDATGRPYEPIKEELVRAVSAVEEWPAGRPLRAARSASGSSPKSAKQVSASP